MRERALHAVALQFWINGTIFASFAPRLPEIRHHLGVELGTIGLLVTLASLGGLAGSVVCGPLIERFGSRRVLLSSAIGLVGSLPLIGFVSGPVGFVAALAALQFFDVLTDVTMNLQGSWLSATRSTPVLNRLHGLWSLGGLVSGFLATRAAASDIPLSTQLLALSIALFGALLFVRPRLLTVDENGPSASPTAPKTRGRRWSTLPFVVLGAAAIVVEMIPADWSAFRLAEDLGAPEGTSGLGFVAFAGAMFAARLVGDALAARTSAQRIVQIALVCSAIGLTTAGAIGSVAVSVFGFALAGAGAALLFPSLYDLAARAPGRPGAMVGALTAGIRLSMLTVPFTVGLLADTDRFSVGAAMIAVTIPAVAVVAGTRSMLQPPTPRRTPPNETPDDPGR